MDTFPDDGNLALLISHTPLTTQCVEIWDCVDSGTEDDSLGSGASGSVVLVSGSGSGPGSGDRVPLFSSQFNVQLRNMLPFCMLPFA